MNLNLATGDGMDTNGARALAEDLGGEDGYLLFEDKPGVYTIWRRQQPMPSNLRGDVHDGCACAYQALLKGRW
jgi:hypothetical protein